MVYAPPVLAVLVGVWLTVTGYQMCKRSGVAARRGERRYPDPTD